MERLYMEKEFCTTCKEEMIITENTDECAFWECPNQCEVIFQQKVGNGNAEQIK